MAKNNLNLDNKFGNCCNCPGFVNDDRLFTNYVSSRIYNDSTMKKLNASNSHEYRNKLQNHAVDIMKNTSKYYNDNVGCFSDDKNKFYIDSSKYGFDTKLSKQYNGP